MRIINIDRISNKIGDVACASASVGFGIAGQTECHQSFTRDEQQD
jgi:hypothetical protein